MRRPNTHTNTQIQFARDTLAKSAASYLRFLFHCVYIYGLVPEYAVTNVTLVDW